jgi:peptidoglycan/LPS O-acetylase OafA/YrhL
VSRESEEKDGLKPTDSALTPREATAPQPLHTGHLPALDGVRGIAILLVMMHHITFFGGMRPVALLDRLYYKATVAGWFGVDLFFVLSGFLITGILFDAKGSEHFFRNFYARRTLRIFPLYYAFLVIYIVALPFFLPIGAEHQYLVSHQIWWWTYLVNVLIFFEGWPPYVGVGHFWSLAVEEQFYLTWPLVLFYCRRQTLIRLCGALFVCSFAVRLALVASGNSVAAYVLMPARMDTLAVGSWLALMVRDPEAEGLRKLAPWAWPATVTAGAVVAAIALWQGGFDSENRLVQTVGYTMLAVLFGGVLLIVLTSAPTSPVGRVFANAGLRAFGRYSYALYIFHHPIIFLLRQSGFSVRDAPIILGSSLPSQIFYAMVVTGITFALAFCSWHLYEAQFLKLKKRFAYHGATEMPEKHHHEISHVAQF